MTEELEKIELELLDKTNKELCESVYKFFRTVPQGMSAFQIRNFALGDLEYPTPDSKYWQAKLFLYVRLQNVISIHYDHRKRKARIRISKAKIEECNYKTKGTLEEYEREILNAKAEIYNIEVEENEFALMNIKKTLNDILLEMKIFLNIMAELEPLLEFSTENKEEQEAQYWTRKSFNDPQLKIRFPEVFKETIEIQKRPGKRPGKT